MAFKKGSTLEYLHTDHLGSTSVTTNTSGTTVSTVKYFPFGGARSQTGTLDTDKRFTGQRLDQTGLYYYNARYYDATIGRFISPDTVVPNPANPQSLNRYSYCLNNPLRYIDPSGHDVETSRGTVPQAVVDYANSLGGDVYATCALIATLMGWVLPGYENTVYSSKWICSGVNGWIAKGGEVNVPSLASCRRNHYYDRNNNLLGDPLGSQTKIVRDFLLNGSASKRTAFLLNPTPTPTGPVWRARDSNERYQTEEQRREAALNSAGGCDVERVYGANGALTVGAADMTVNAAAVVPPVARALSTAVGPEDVATGAWVIAGSVFGFGLAPEILIAIGIMWILGTSAE
ncbi:MAG: RHS repeat-associated core domain-containing protein [Chloroflexi bacterium]|nr:RHS repeat-associated core domain-containing protein [Chloroflexota bacterium]